MEEKIPVEGITEPAEAVLGLTDTELATYLQTSELGIALIRQDPSWLTREQAARATSLDEIAHTISSGVHASRIQEVIRRHSVPRLDGQTYAEAIVGSDFEATVILDVIRIGLGLEPKDHTVYEQTHSNSKH